MNETNLKSKQPTSVSRLTSRRLWVLRQLLSVGTAGAFVLGVSGLAAQANGKTTATNEEVEIPRSVFVMPSSPKDGRDPFFPHSTRLKPQMPVAVRPTEVNVSELVLNGIVPSGSHPSAMINGKTFEQGEEADVKLPDGGRLPVKVLEIKEESVVITVKGQRRELRLRHAL
jgi:hypothetical protein